MMDIMDSDPRQILIVEDDTPIARLMQMHVQAGGHRACCCADGNKAIELLQEHSFKLIILDRMLPGADGMRVLRFIRRTSQEEMIPVLMVTALDRTADRIQGLNEGADDYLSKPFEPDELMARVQALLRRSMPADTGRLRAGGIEVNPDIYEVSVNGRSITLRPLEYRLLQFLMKKPGKTRSREYLLNHVWGRDAFVEPRTVDVTVKRLRKALKACGAGDCVETVRGMGYRFYTRSLSDL